MKLLMVQLPTSHLGSGEKVYPLGLSRLSALVPETIDRQALDMNICPDPWQSLKAAVEAQQPDMVALSFRNLDPLAGQQFSYLSSLKTAGRLIRTLLPDAWIFAGGPAFSLFSRRLMEIVPEIDAGIVGEGENIFASLLAFPDAPEKLPGMIYRNGETLIANRAGTPVDLDPLPHPDTEQFPPSDYAGANSYVAAMGIEGKRGCDLQCGYCLYPRLGGRCMRLRSPARIVDEMEQMKNEWGINLFHFTDSVVNRPPDHFESVCKELIRRRLNVAWTGFFREDSLSPKLLDTAVASGLIAVYFSGDALNRKSLALLNKRLTPEDILDAARLTAQNGILTMCHFLVNLPGEDDADIRESQALLDQILDIHAPAANLGAVIFNHVRLYPGAPLTRRLIRSGVLSPDTDLIYPVYYNPEPYSHLLHDFEARCHDANVFSRLGVDRPGHCG